MDNEPNLLGLDYYGCSSFFVLSLWWNKVLLDDYLFAKIDEHFSFCSSWQNIQTNTSTTLFYFLLNLAVLSVSSNLSTYGGDSLNGIHNPKDLCKRSCLVLVDRVGASGKLDSLMIELTPIFRDDEKITYNIWLLLLSLFFTLNQS